MWARASRAAWRNPLRTGALVLALQLVVAWAPSAASALSPGVAGTFPPQGIQLPAPRGYINDFANVIPPASAGRIQRIIDDVRRKSGGEIVVVTLPDIGQRDVADVAREIGRQWKVGRAGQPGDPARNTGVIILIVPRETNSDGRGRFRIETGLGAEGFLPDGVTGAIQDQALPLLRAQDYGGALELTTLLVADRFAR